MAPQSANSLRGTVGYSALSEGPQLRPGLARLALHIMAVAMTLAACDDAGGPSTGQTGVRIVTTTTGLDLDPNGYLVTVDGTNRGLISRNDTLVIPLDPGSRTIALYDLTPNCTIAGSGSRTVTVVAEKILPVAFTVTCTATTGVRIVTTTTGLDIDPNGYRVTVDGTDYGLIPPNDSLLIPLDPGSRTIGLTGLTPNCTIAGSGSRIVTVVASEILPIVFVITCSALSITKVSPGTTDNQQGTAGQSLANDLEVLVTEDGSPKVGVVVVWSASDGAIVGHGPTDALGHASATWTLGTTVGQQQATASVSSSNGVGYFAVAENDVAADLIHPGGINGDNQRGGTTTTLPNRLRVRVVDQFGNGVDGATVVWLVLSEPGSGTTLDPVQSISDQSGEASTEVTLGDSAGPVVVRAMVAIGASQKTADFTLTAFTWTTALAFVSGRDGNPEIYTMNADGSAQARLTNNGAIDDDPRWSPDGQSIAFVSTRGGTFEIYVMNADGSTQTRLTNNSLQDDSPVWSPDGQKIAFVRGQEIHVMNADGSAQTKLTGGAGDRGPQWSPDGQKIVFFSSRDGNDEIYTMNADGSGQTRLTNNTRSDGFPMWSPNGQKIAFGGGHEIYVMNPDGSGQTGLTTHSNFYQRGGWGPTWSLDGQHIAFDGDPYDPVIRLVSANGGPLTFLAFGAYPDWSGSRQKIAFDLREIYVMNEDGSARTRLTNKGGYKARWRP